MDGICIIGVYIIRGCGGDGLACWAKHNDYGGDTLNLSLEHLVRLVRILVHGASYLLPPLHLVEFDFIMLL